jgi:dTDP-4-dehydrorhamnose 3,5-epimerase
MESACSRDRSTPTTGGFFWRCSARGRAWWPDMAACNFPGAIKAFHYHLHQTDCFTPVAGLLQIALVDLRKGSPTFGLKNTIYAGSLCPWQVLIPAGVGHGYKVIGTERSLLVYASDRFYNPQDEGRIAYNDPGINYDWEMQHK